MRPFDAPPLCHLISSSPGYRIWLLRITVFNLCWMVKLYSKFLWFVFIPLDGFLEHSVISLLLSESFHAGLQSEVTEKHLISGIVECGQSWPKRENIFLSSWLHLLNYLTKILNESVNSWGGKTKESSTETKAFEIGPYFSLNFVLICSSIYYSLEKDEVSIIEEVPRPQINKMNNSLIC